MSSQIQVAQPPRSTRHRRPRRLGDLLCERKVISDDQLEAALNHQKDVAPGKLLGQILIDLDMASADKVVEVMAESVNTPFAVLEPSMVHPEALNCLPLDLLKKQNLLPLSLTEDWLTIAVEQFTNIFLIEDISRRAGCQVQVVAATADNIRLTRDAVLSVTAAPTCTSEDADEALDGLLGQIGVGDLKVVEQEQRDNAADLEAAATDSPVVKLVNYIIQNAVNSRASDIHIEPEETVFRVRFRIDGELVESVRPTSRLLPAVVSRIKIMSGMDISERRLPQDGGVSVMISERPIDLRVSTMTTKLGEKVVMRIVDRNAAVQSLDTLGFEPQMLKRFRAAVQQPNGVILVTGPTGSGKTTTLYGVLAELVSDKYNISTIEDPVERRLIGTNQFQVHPQAGFTFARALRSLLRQDPDIIMVGEIRDVETAKLATEAALTGHLVLSTLHTNDALTAVPRLINMGVEPYLVAASLRGVLAQRLVRRICSHCRKVNDLTPALRETLIQICGGQCPIDMAYVGGGCARCRGVGHVGRVGVYEMLLLNEEMLSGIAREASMSNLRQVASRHGLTTLLQDGLEKVRRGLISMDGLLEIVAVTDDTQRMEQRATTTPDGD